MKRFFYLACFFLVSGTLMAQTARVQVIHNSADALAAEVDVYLNDTNALDNFAFREASPFLDLPAGVEINLSIAPGNSTSVADALLTVPVTLTPDETYIVVADGIVSPTGYNPAPPLGLEVYAMGREAATSPSNTDVLVHHGSTDAPTVDVVESGVGAGTIVDNLSYKDFQGYLELPTTDYVLQIRDETGSVGVAAYQAPLGTLMLEGAALVVVASGFLDPTQNSDGPNFGLYVALPAGGPLVELPAAALGVNDVRIDNWVLYPNPAAESISLQLNESLEFANLKVQIIDMHGRIIKEMPLQSTNQTLEIGSLSTGIFQVNILNENSNVLQTIRMVKE